MKSYAARLGKPGKTAAAPECANASSWVGRAQRKEERTLCLGLLHKLVTPGHDIAFLPQPAYWRLSSRAGPTPCRSQGQ